MKKEKRRLKNKSLKIIIIVISLVVVILISFLLVNKIKENNSLSEEKIIYKNYKIENEEYLKSKCAYIRVGRCDIVGGSFGKECWFRQVSLIFELDNLNPDAIICEAIIDEKLSEQKFIKSEGEYLLNFEIDIRKKNEIDLCCQSKNQERICFETIKTEAIC